MESIKKIDWSKLREQKQTLLNIIDEKEHSSCEVANEEASDLEGIISLIDSIQDEAVEIGIAKEEEVFNLSEDND